MKAWRYLAILVLTGLFLAAIAWLLSDGQVPFLPYN